jgi:hypothetical protein
MHSENFSASCPMNSPLSVINFLRQLPTSMLFHWRFQPDAHATLSFFSSLLDHRSDMCTPSSSSKSYISSPSHLESVWVLRWSRTLTVRQADSMAWLQYHATCSKKTPVSCYMQ